LIPTRKLHDALNNVDYTGSDLYRNYSEASKDLCKLARELDGSDLMTIEG
jgi:hypothetical protein